MKHLDWQMLLFVGSSLIHDYWVYWGLPKIHYCDIKQKHLKATNKDNEDDIIA